MSRIDRATGRVARIFVDDGPSSIVASGDDVWVAHAYAGTLSRIDSRSNAVTSLAVGSSPRALTFVGDGIWTASGAIGGGEHVGGTLTVEGDLVFDAESVDPARAYYPPVNSMLRPVYDWPTPSADGWASGPDHRAGPGNGVAATERWWPDVHLHDPA